MASLSRDILIAEIRMLREVLSSLERISKKPAVLVGAVRHNSVMRGICQRKLVEFETLLDALDERERYVR